jgi:hypothetical protein
LRGLRQVLRALSLITGNRDSQVCPVLHNFRATDAETIYPLVDDLPGERELIVGRKLSGGRACGKDDLSATLQVDPELRLWLTITREED